MSNDPTLSVLHLVQEQTRRAQSFYAIDRGLVEEHASGERRISQGGYGDRQIYELVQNGVDELLGERGGQVSVILTEAHLYCANQGNPMTPAGADTILRMGLSKKRGGQIGRFGVGVKSVLSVTDTPEFFSRHPDRSFGFSREWSERRIRDIWPDISDADIPVLRMAFPLDVESAKDEDPTLNELLEWATTVVRLPLKADHAERLGHDLDSFPHEFPLFSPHVGSVVLEDRRGGHTSTKRISRTFDDGLHRLKVESGGRRPSESAWHVFTREHVPSETALADAGELHDRGRIDISWAVPAHTGGGRARSQGRFWAYFPTNFVTTLRGIVNAPWKTSEDRQNLYQGNRFNDELLQVTAELVVDSLKALSFPEDPCAHLDVVPARGREEAQFASKGLVDRFWTHATTEPVLPDQTGQFRTADDLRLHPHGLRPPWLEAWAAHTGRPDGWCHHSVEQTPHRRSSADRIMELARVPAATVVDWLEALVEDGTPEASRAAVHLMADICRNDERLGREALMAEVVLTERHGMVSPSSDVFRRSGTDELADDMIYVDERVLIEPEDHRALKSLGVHEADAAGRFASVLSKGFSGYDTAKWEALWHLSRLAGPADTLSAVRASGISPSEQLRLRTVAGTFRPVRECLAPGPVVPFDGSRDQAIAVDLHFHRPERHFLSELGLLDGPVERVDPQISEPWYKQYREKVWESYCQKLPPSARRPNLGTMHFEGAAPAGPLRFLTVLSEEGRAAFVKALPKDGLVFSWTVRAGRNKDAATIISPLRWMVHEHGRVPTSRGLGTLHEAVGPQLARHRRLLPVADLPTSTAQALGLPTTPEEVPGRVWRRILDEAGVSEDDTFPGEVYGLFLESGRDWPDGTPTRCRVGAEWSSEYPDGEIAVTADRDTYDTLVRASTAALLAPDRATADRLREDWGMLAPEDVLQKEVHHAPSSEPVPVLDLFPHLRLRGSGAEGWWVVRCSELQVIHRGSGGLTTNELTSATVENTVMVLRPDDDTALLEAIDRELGLGLGPVECRDLVRTTEEKRKNEHWEKARRSDSPAGKLLALIGVEDIKAGLPAGLLHEEGTEGSDPLSEHEIAQLAENSYGPDLLRHYRQEIEAKVPEASARFNGDSRSNQVTNRLGLDMSYAGQKEEKPLETEVVQGPRAYPRLHAYQEDLASRMFDLLTRYRAGKGMLSLPTGAGKTRIAAEAVIRVIKEQGLKGRPVLWIAQSSELCEQAVQSWSFVWGKVGPERPLTVSRLRESNQAAPVRDGNPHLVVATDAKLEKCLHTEEYAWLRDPALVLIDEAHVATSPRYTQILRELGITHRSSERPLIGLTATPFRGSDTEETERLVQRFGRNRLEKGVFGTDPYSHLQELGVLARVEHRQLTGATFELNRSELEHVEKSAFTNALPSTAEQRLAKDRRRNAMLLEEIQALPDDEPVLLFATSVAHAQLLTAELNRRKIPAAHIDSTTPTGRRRRVIDDYRRGRIRVLANFGVLAQGFDAPATRTVIVARPTYSPNVYQQMIGRGLRGPLNGGKSLCRILDVEDNVTNFGKQLSFTDFESLWSRT